MIFFLPTNLPLIHFITFLSLSFNIKATVNTKIKQEIKSKRIKIVF